MPRRRKKMIDYIKGWTPRLFGWLREKDWELLAFITRKMIEAHGNPNPDKEEEPPEWLRDILGGGETPMQETKEEQQVPVAQQPIDLQVGFLMATVYKHLTRVAELLQLLSTIYPDLKSDFAPAVDKWVEELDNDVRAGFGFSITESEDDETE